MRLEMLSLDSFKKLTSEQEGPLVSMYVPLSSEGHTKENAKHVDLALSNAERHLGEMGLSPKGCAQFLAPVKAYIESNAAIPHGAKTLALLLSPSSFFPFMLPVETPEMLQVGPHFCVAPLLPLLRKNADCYVLAVSKKSVRLLHVNSEGVHEVQVDGMPASFEAESAEFEHQDKEMQHHSGQSGSGGAIFHGGRGASDREKEGVEANLHKVMKAVDHVLTGQHAPLFFAGIEEEIGMLRKYVTYPNVQQHFIHGNPDAIPTEDLYDKTVELMQPLWQKESEVAMEVYGPLAGTGRTSTDLQAILDLSYHGKAEGLLVAQGALQWGKVNPDSGIAELHERQEAGDTDLIGLAAIHTIQHKGWVRSLPQDQMPEGAMLAAVLRY